MSSEPLETTSSARHPAAVEPAGEARHELWILQELAKRLGVDEIAQGSIADWKRRAMQRLEGAGVGLERIESGPVRNPFAAKVLFDGRRFPTPTGKARLLDHGFSDLAREEADDYPLTLLAVSTPKAQSSQWSVDPGEGRPEARLHPDSADGIADGSAARLESRIGSLEVRIRHDTKVHPRTVLMEKGGMFRQGRCVNALVRAVETDDGHGAAYYDEPVRIVATGH